MSLARRLDEIRDGAAERLGEDTVEALHRSTERLREAGVADGALGEGDRAPSFVLENQSGETVRMEGLLQEGPVVLTFFRGYW